MARKRYASDQRWNEKRRKAPATPARSTPPAPRARASSRTRQSHPPRAFVAPEAPRRRTAGDFAAFTRPRSSGRSSSSSAPSSPALPTLAELAAEEAPELAHVSGGSCPGCNAHVADDDRHCQKCGRALQRRCSKCDRPMRPDQQFCAECGGTAPSSSSSSGPSAELERALAPAWTPDDCFMVGAGVDLVLVHWDAPILEDDDRDRINTRAAAVANKHLRIGSRWKEEIMLGMAIAGALFPAAYHHYVIGPEARRRAAERAERARASSSSSAPSSASSSSSSAPAAAV